MFTGNKGEWSEVYVFLKLLADGKLDAADASLNVLKGVFYPLIQIIRVEKDKSVKHYNLNGDINIIDGLTNKLIIKIPKCDFLEKSKFLLDQLQKKKGRSFSISEIDGFLNKIEIQSLSAEKTKKEDITIVVHDLKTGLKPTLGFSIKSLLGQNATLFNPGSSTNFIFKIGNIKLTEKEIKLINSINIEPKIQNRILHLRNLGADLNYYDIESENLKLNLQLIDSQLPEIIGYMLYYKYEQSIHLLTKLLEKISKDNPLKYNLGKGHPFYEYKIKGFLTDSALGMTPAKLWKGIYDATGGIIIVKKDGNLVCYHIYNKNEFQDYLVNNTRLEQASLSRYRFGEVYKHNGDCYIKLNLQIRFT